MPHVEPDHLGANAKQTKLKGRKDLVIINKEAVEQFKLAVGADLFLNSLYNCRTSAS